MRIESWKERTLRRGVLPLLVVARLLCGAAGAHAQLSIVEPTPGSVRYQQDEIALHARWDGTVPDSALAFVWSDQDGARLADGLNASFKNLPYRLERITLRALQAGAVLDSAVTSVSVVVRPTQFTLSESTDWEGDVSPNGSLVAYTSFRSGDPEIWIAGLANRGVSQVTHQSGWNPSWSADGRYLVFWSERSGIRDLWLLEQGKDHLSAEKLTSGAGYDWMPACSPVDSRVAYCSKRGRRLSIRVLDYTQPAGVQPQEVVGPEWHPMFPRWFPDGQNLLFTAYNDTLPVVCRMSLLDGQVQKVSAPDAEDADISPDGKLVVMVRQGNLWLHRMQDGFERQLTLEGAGVLSPRFFPDGRKVIFASTLSGNYDLWLLDLPESY